MGTVFFTLAGSGSPASAASRALLVAAGLAVLALLASAADLVSRRRTASRGDDADTRGGDDATADAGRGPGGGPAAAPRSAEAQG